MKVSHTISLLTFLVLTQLSHSAVHLSSNKTGSAIIIPFYTVSNQMNTLLSLNNTKNDNKAVKIHIKEAKNGDLIASFNVYLTGQDIWTMGMGQVNGELKLISGDRSCTAGFPHNENIPLDEDWLWENGTIEIIEMAVLDHVEAPFSYRNCGIVHDGWMPNEDFTSPASGGLHAEVTLMDVEQGHSANIPVVHLGGFFDANNPQFTAAGMETPNLSSGTKDSLVMIDGQAIKTTWPTGYEAVSALLMKNTLSNEFNLEPEVFAHTEWIVSFPTMHYHLSAEVEDTKPFKLSAYGDDSKFMFPTHYWDVFYYDRSGVFKSHIPCGGCSPPPPEIKINSVINLLTYLDTQNTPPFTSLARPIPNLTSEHRDNIYYLSASIIRELATQDNFWSYNNGKIKLNIAPLYTNNNDRGKDIQNPEITHELEGLPIVGFSYTRFTNANAQPGLLAQYAFVREHFGEKKVIIGEVE